MSKAISEETLIEIILGIIKFSLIKDLQNMEIDVIK
jgi:hypothetical protein